MAGSGARVLQLRAVEFARNHGVPLHVRSTFTDADGTWIREDTDMEAPIISGITHTIDEAYVTLTDVPDKPGTQPASSTRSPPPTLTSTRSSRTP